jgi:hypothetical protein
MRRMFEASQRHPLSSRSIISGALVEVQAITQAPQLMQRVESHT